jgi:phage tail protein X
MLDEYSRFRRTIPYVDDRYTHLLTIRRRFTFNEQTAKHHRVKVGETVDGLALKYYGNEKFWWAIMDANPRYMTEMDIQVGDVLIVPDFEEVVAKLNG